MQQTEIGLGLSTKRTCKREFRGQGEQVVPWPELADIVWPCAPQRKTDRPPFDVKTMMRIHFKQQWFTLSEPAMESSMHDMPMFREFARRLSGLGRRKRKSAPARPVVAGFAGP